MAKLETKRGKIKSEFIIKKRKHFKTKKKVKENVIIISRVEVSLCLKFQMNRSDAIPLSSKIVPLLVEGRNNEDKAITMMRGKSPRSDVEMTKQLNFVVAILDFSRAFLNQF